ncbi:MAG: hypothetical protein Q9182_007623 [Xanthomendoza sp. 2 TL-2023]
MPLPSIEEPLHEVEDTQELQRAAATLDHSTSPILVPDSGVREYASPSSSLLSSSLYLLSSISDYQRVGSSDAALKEIEPQSSEEGDSNKGDSDCQNQRAGQKAGKATSATDTRDSSKRTAHSAGLNKDSDGRQSSERANDATENSPVVLEDESPVADNCGALIKATSNEPVIGAAPLFSSHPIEDPKTPGCINACTDSDLHINPLDQPHSLDVARPQHHTGRVVREDDRGADAVANPPSATTPPPPQQSKVRTPALALKEWGFRRLVGKRRVGESVEYKVRWEDSWLRRSELRNAKRLLHEFEAQVKRQRGSK